MTIFRTDYKGYAKEALLYPACIFRSKPKISKRFIIFGVPRSGTTLVVNLLDALPTVKCEGELWSHPLLWPERYVECRAQLCKKHVFGFKLLITHFEKQKVEDPGAVIARFYHQGYQILSLRRKNVYRAALSNLYAEHLGAAYVRSSDHKIQRDAMVVEPQTVLKKLQRFDYLIQRHQAALKDIPHIDIVYEDNLLAAADQQNTIHRISEFLQVPCVPVTSDLLRVTSDQVKDFVQNAEEIDAFVRGTEYAHFLDS